jgi:two-component system phosphate regulon response regulator PhoB
VNSPRRKNRILIADDEPNLRLLIQTTLEAPDTTLYLAATGAAALDEARRCSPDLILLDWMMPEVSGIDVLRELRRDSGLPRIPVIMLTAKGQEPDRQTALDAGADAFLVKPFSPLELLQKVQEVLHRDSRKNGDERKSAASAVRSA